MLKLNSAGDLIWHQQWNPVLSVQLDHQQMAFDTVADELVICSRYVLSSTENQLLLLRFDTDFQPLVESIWIADDSSKILKPTVAQVDSASSNVVIGCRNDDKGVVLLRADQQLSNMSAYEWRDSSNRNAMKPVEIIVSNGILNVFGQECYENAYSRSP